MDNVCKVCRVNVMDIARSCGWRQGDAGVGYGKTAGGMRKASLLFSIDISYDFQDVGVRPEAVGCAEI